jgi:hypothetical protein
MEQLTKEQAIALYNSKEWENWDDEKIVRFQLFQARLAIPFGRFHEAIEKVLNRPVFTHEFGLNHKGLIEEYLGARNAPTFEEIIGMIPEKKRVVFLIKAAE